MEKKYIKDFKAGEEIITFLALRKLELKSKSDGGKFLRIELGDKSGRIGGVIWEQVDQLYPQLSVGKIVKIKGVVESYQDVLRLKIEKIRLANEGEYDKGDFIPVVEKDRQALLNKIKAAIEEMNNPFLKKLLTLFFGDPQFEKVFINAVGGKLWHHAYIGGLLEHTVNVMEFCRRAADLYKLVDKDLLLAGAILHDIGKVREYEYSSYIDFSDEGRLRGHIVIGDEMVREKIKEILNFPPELKKKLSHLILAHQGFLEFGSPVVPMMLESLILFYADELDAKANAFCRIIQRNLAERPDKRWSEWISLMERFIYLGDRSSEKLGD